jgi:hypothetical protein
MQIQYGKMCSSLFQKSIRDYKAEQRRYFERLKRKALSGQRPVKTAGHR